MKFIILLIITALTILQANNEVDKRVGMSAYELAFGVKDPNAKEDLKVTQSANRIVDECFAVAYARDNKNVIGITERQVKATDDYHFFALVSDIAYNIKTFDSGQEVNFRYVKTYKSGSNVIDRYITLDGIAIIDNVVGTDTVILLFDDSNVSSVIYKCKKTIIPR